MTSTGKLIALIPARSGSKRVPGKNIRELAGHPLIAYTIQVAKDSGLFDSIMVCSDSLEYRNVAKKYGALSKARKKASEMERDFDWLLPIYRQFADNDITYFLLRPTNPFRSVDMLLKACDVFEYNRPSSLRAVELVKQHPLKMWSGNNSPYIGTRGNAWDNWWERSTQSLESVYVQNGSLEIFKGETLSKGDVSGDNIALFHTQGYEGFDINTEDDWILAEALIERGLATLPEIK